MLWFWNNEPIEQDVPKEVEVGDFILDNKGRHGIVKCVGGNESEGIWYGVELEETSKNSSVTLFPTQKEKVLFSEKMQQIYLYKTKLKQSKIGG